MIHLSKWLEDAEQNNHYSIVNPSDATKDKEQAIAGAVQAPNDFDKQCGDSMDDA